MPAKDRVGRANRPIAVATSLTRAMRLLNEHGEGQTLAIMHQTGITLPQLVSLQNLHLEGRHTISALGRRINLSLAATSHLVDRLVVSRLVARTEDPTDRRRRFVEITDEGRQLVDRLGATKRDALARAITKIPQAVQARLGSALDEVVAALEGTG